MSTSGRLAALFSGLMLVAAAAFVIGVTIEKSQGHTDSSVVRAHSDETSETHEQTEGEPAEGQSEESETIGGIDVESTPIILLGVALSLVVSAPC